MLRLHILRYVDEDDVRLNIDSELSHETSDAIQVHHNLAHFIDRLVAIKKCLSCLLEKVGKARSGATT